MDVWGQLEAAKLAPVFFPGSPAKCERPGGSGDQDSVRESAVGLMTKTGLMEVGRTQNTKGLEKNW